MKPLSKIIDFSDMQDAEIVDPFQVAKLIGTDKIAIKQATKKGYIEAPECCVADLTYPNSETRRGRVQGDGLITGTLTATTNLSVINFPKFRKIKTSEAWELMGFTKEQHDRAAAVCSASQLYKQAGNSIVVDVLIELLTPIMENFEGDTVRVLELFGGIGAPRAALERMGYKVISDYVEIDKHAVASYNAIFWEDNKQQSVTEFNAVGKVYDLVFHGSPCQDFSIAGLMAGADQGSGTRSSLMWETVRIVNESSAGYVIWENVKAVLSNKHIDTFNKYIEQMEVLGYITNHEVINAVDCGIPQNRERLFATSKRSKNDN